MHLRKCKVCNKEFDAKFKSRKRVCCSDKCSKENRQNILHTHKSSYTRLYAIWSDMKARCNSRKDKLGKHYQDKSITICKSWNESFESFKAWAVKAGYKNNLELDRKDNKLGYYPSNCRWATDQQQCFNKPKRSTKCTSKYKGVSLLRPGVWRVQISINRKPTYIGSFTNEIKAAREYDRQARNHHGEFASLNFPDT